jgi:hypothetical protein
MDSRTRLLNAPRGQRRLLAVLLPLGLGLAALAIAAGAYASLRAKAERLAERRERLGRLEQIVASMPAATAEAAEAGSGPEFLEGESDTLVQAAFQSRLREIAAASGAEVLAVGNTPIVLREEARFAGLRTSISGPNDAIVETIYAIETSEPYLTIRSARINAYGEAASGKGPPELLLQMQFEGALPTEGVATTGPDPGPGPEPASGFESAPEAGQ